MNNAFQEELTDLSRKFRAVSDRIGEYVVGHRALLDLINVALLSEGHILIEGSSGTAKTTIAKICAQLLGCGFQRMQGAVDIQPADILGIHIYDADRKDFFLKKGPIFGNVILIDEVNRLNPKTQSAFIEAMSERQVTIDGITMQLNRPFFVIATKNPYEFGGVFPLINAQKDRFLFSIRLNNLDPDEELKVIERADRGDLDWDSYSKGQALLSPEAIVRSIETVKKVHTEPPIHQYIRDMVMATRSHSNVRLGASTRASIALIRSAKAVAALAGRPYVIPDDVKGIVPPVLRHRLVVTREAEISGVTPDQVIREILEEVEVR